MGVDIYGKAPKLIGKKPEMQQSKLIYNLTLIHGWVMMGWG